MCVCTGGGGAVHPKWPDRISPHWSLCPGGGGQYHCKKDSNSCLPAPPSKKKYHKMLSATLSPGLLPYDRVQSIRATIGHRTPGESREGKGCQGHWVLEQIHIFTAIGWSSVGSEGQGENCSPSAKQNNDINSLFSIIGPDDFLAHHAIAFGLHTTKLILVKGALDARGSKLIPDKQIFVKVSYGTVQDVVVHVTSLLGQCRAVQWRSVVHCGVVRCHLGQFRVAGRWTGSAAHVHARTVHSGRAVALFCCFLPCKLHALTYAGPGQPLDQHPTPKS